MPCYNPISAYQDKETKLIHFTLEEDLSPTELSRLKGKSTYLELPCRKCIGCMNRYKTDWTTRILHEAQPHIINLFMTPTYAQEYLPEFGFINYKDIQAFHKRLRDRIYKWARRNGMSAKQASEYAKFRFVFANEYGTRFNRPHGHGIYFGINIPDLKKYGEKGGIQQYRSTMIEESWGKGMIQIGAFTPGAAGYVSKYLIKEQGKNAKELVKQQWYATCQAQANLVRQATGDPEAVAMDLATGQLWPEEKPLPSLRMSNQPGIGFLHYEKWKHDMFPRDYLHINGRQLPVPEYYFRKYKEEHPEEAEKIKQKREQEARARMKTPERLKELEAMKKREMEFFSKKAKL